MSIHVRLATIQDVEKIASLFDAYRQFYGKPSDIALASRFLTERVSRNESTIFVAENPVGETVGFTQMYPSFSSVRAARIYVLNDLYVHPNARRLGAAKQLLVAAADFGRSSGAVKLLLSTALTNATAQRLYESMGWKRDEEFCEYGLTL